MQAGATHIQFNPLADTFAAKALVAMAEREGLPLSKEAAKHLAVQSAGDLFHAIETLQLACVGRERVAPASRKVGVGWGWARVVCIPAFLKGIHGVRKQEIRDVLTLPLLSSDVSACCAGVQRWLAHDIQLT